ncbi:MAG: DNA adenine methylase [Clostridia bacterium]|nr:DNA adenine methylase [Clostridia bacterium]MBQ9720443.1 DNA adenine methylase [Oscillospiraceae bacterium]
MGYRYIGSKARVADDIARHLGFPDKKAGCFIDAFCGTGIVASKAADLGWKIKINDMMYSAAVMSEARLLSTEDVPFSALGGYQKALDILNQAELSGFIWREYSPASLNQVGIERGYFTEENARKIDGAVATVHRWKKDGTISDKEFVLLMSTLIYAVNNIANIAGTYGCFLSNWQPQALEPLCLMPLDLRKEKVSYSASTDDVFDIRSEEEDVVYLDPPYTKRQYASYYHILETITLGDEPVVSGVTGLRPWKSKASVFCYKAKALRALVSLASSQTAKRVLISYSNDGHVQLDQLIGELKKTGTVEMFNLGAIGRYRPNQVARLHRPEVNEYLIDYRRGGGDEK